METQRFSAMMAGGLLFLAIVLSAHLSRAQKPTASSDFAVHEWGTFSSIAGSNGQAIRWLPLSGNNDLPSFVEHFSSAGFKAGLNGTVRMETPVMYFYTPRKMTAAVSVRFAKGVITEWYPHASSVEPSARLNDVSLYEKGFTEGRVVWNSVALDPGAVPDLPRDGQSSRYYTARLTSATPLSVESPNGKQPEKFLFYRGVSTFSVPISALVLPEGNVTVRSSSGEAIPKIILFERRGTRVGYRVRDAMDTEATLETPELTGTVEAAENELETALIAQGLYPDEARAMIETWNDSWFEEGSRLIYIVPERFVDTMLPLAISPAPEQRARVFVGRLELITPGTEKAVESALASHDEATLAKYGRFLEPILNEIEQIDTAHANALREEYVAALRSGFLPGVPQSQR